MRYNTSFYALIFLLTFSSNQCNKPPVIPKPPTVYVVGETLSDPEGAVNLASGILWINGKPSLLDKGNYINTFTGSVNVSGKDVYVAGTSEDNSTSKATLWKNGIPTYLNSSTGNTYGLQVLVVSNNVYVRGTNTGFDFRTIIWKNGAPSYYYNDLEGESSCMFINGNDLYVSGIDKSSGKYLPVIYKNNDITFLPVPVNFTVASNRVSVYVNGSDVYVSGTVRNNNRFKAVLWKNGQLSYLDTTYNSAASIIQGIGSDVYVLGSIQKEGQAWHNIVWKNGQRFFIQINSNISFHSLFVFNRDIYMAGGEFGTIPSKALVNKNSTTTYLMSAPNLNMTCYANDVFVAR